MKALSLKQPWADLVVDGRKTIELRTWKVSYRGELAIHASQSIHLEACQGFGLDARRKVTGAVIGIVELADIIELDEARFEATKDQHLASGYFRAPIYGWVLMHPQRLEQPIPVGGRMGLFNVDLILPTQSQNQAVEPEPVGSKQRLSATFGFDTRAPFELGVIKDTEVTNPLGYRLTIYQRQVEKVSQPDLAGNFAPELRHVVELGLPALPSVMDVVLDALRHSGYSAPDLHANRKAPFRLSEENGVRLALLFLAVRPVSKLARVEAISRAIRLMSGEELYYWFSKCAVADRSMAERAQKALRMLLADE